MRPSVETFATAGKFLVHSPGNMKTDAPSSPLHTYRRKGVGAKAPSAQDGHVMLHSTEIPPLKQEGEIHMTKDPLAVKMYHGFRFGEFCRADLKVVWPIYYGQRVEEMGVVKTRSLAKLLHYREEIHESGKTGRRLRVTKPKLEVDSCWNI